MSFTLFFSLPATLFVVSLTCKWPWVKWPAEWAQYTHVGLNVNVRYRSQNKSYEMLREYCMPLFLLLTNDNRSIVCMHQSSSSPYEMWSQPPQQHAVPSVCLLPTVRLCLSRETKGWFYLLVGSWTNQIPQVQIFLEWHHYSDSKDSLITVSQCLEERKKTLKHIILGLHQLNTIVFVFI